MTVRARRSHEIPSRSPIQLEPGEPVMVGERSIEWPAFVFITAADGQGWVPARHLSADDGAAIVEVAYDTTELAVTKGEEVTVVERDDESGWWWCRAANGGEGWVPVAVLDPS